MVFLQWTVIRNYKSLRRVLRTLTLVRFHKLFGNKHNNTKFNNSFCTLSRQTILYTHVRLYASLEITKRFLRQMRPRSEVGVAPSENTYFSPSRNI